MCVTYLRNIAFACLLLLCFSRTQAGAYECLKIAVTTQSPEIFAPIATGVANAFESAGVCLRVVFLPLKRIKKELMKGRIDGELMRGTGYIEEMKEFAVAIPTPIHYTTGHIVTYASRRFLPQKVSDIGNHKIAVFHGIEWQEAKTRGVPNLRKGDDYLDFVRQLKAGRIDGFLVESDTIELLIRFQVISREDVFVSPVIENIPSYTLLHKKYKHLVDKLNTALQTAIKNGKLIIPH